MSDLTNRNIISESLVDVVKRNRICDRPMLIFGSPGVGKSQQVWQSIENDETCIDLRLNSLDSIDLRGLPAIQKDEKGNPTKVTWIRPEFLPYDGKGIIFFDEINTAPPSVQNPALQLILDRKVGNHHLGDGWYIVAAGNRSEDRAHVYPLSSALIARFAVYDYVPSVDNWIDWAIKSGIHPDVIGFISFRRELLVQPIVDEYTPSANPRSWSYVSDRLKNNFINLADIRACVGSSSGEFMAYLDVCRSLPDIDKLASGKKGWKEDKKKISVSYAVASALASYLIEHKNPEKIFENCANVLLDISPEPAALFIKRIMNDEKAEKIRDVAYESKNISEWLEKNDDLIKTSTKLG